MFRNENLRENLNTICPLITIYAYDAKYVFHVGKVIVDNSMIKI
jgi:hypothetical protein